MNLLKILGAVRRWTLLVCMVLFSSASGASRCLAADSPPKREITPRPLTPRELSNQRKPKPATPAPIIIEGTMRHAMGYPRVFARIFFNGQPVMGRPAQDVIQRARALDGNLMDLNLAASSGPHSWWTAVLDTGAESHSVNQDTAQRFGLRDAGDVLAVVTGVDGQGIKVMSWVYALNLAGSNGHLSEEPNMPFGLVQQDARFTLELKAYQPMRKAEPEGANLIGMSAIRQLAVEIDNGNATVAMLSESFDMSSARAFEESLRGKVAGPRVRFLPPAFRPTNEVVRIPLRYLNARRMVTPGNEIAPVAATSPFVMGVRSGQVGKTAIGNFLFDTGASQTIISRRVAYQLGLIANANPANDKPEFQGGFTGINDREITAAGFTIDTLEMLSPGGQVITWRNVPLLVHDVAMQQADGTMAVHDGILGNNLFMASSNGELTERGLKVNPPPFERYWIHGPLGEIWFQRPAIKPAE